MNLKPLSLVLFLAIGSVMAQTAPEATASEVVDRGTLKKFVESAKAYLLRDLGDVNKILEFGYQLKTEGDWKHGNMYLMFLFPNGVVLFHGGDQAIRGANIYNITDERGDAVVQNLIKTVREDGGGFVDYYWDDPQVDGDENAPRSSYATQIVFGNNQYILVGGYHQDFSNVAFPEIGDTFLPRPKIKASDVVDRQTLKAFVKEVIKAYGNAVNKYGFTRREEIKEAFRGENWRFGQTYIYIFTTEGYVLFHGANRSLETMNMYDLEDVNGVRILQELIKVARAGGGFVEYYYDDPTIEGDEDIGSPKLGYAERVFTKTGHELIMGSGLYFNLADYTPEITLSLDPSALMEGDSQTVTVTANQFSEALPVTTRLLLSFSGTAADSDYNVAGDGYIIIPAESTVGSSVLTFHIANNSVESDPETIIVTANHVGKPRASATLTIDKIRSTTVVTVFLSRNERPISGAMVEFSKSIAGLAPQYQWEGKTDDKGIATIEIQGQSISGYYLARAKKDGRILDTWSSIPINKGESLNLSLSVGNRAERSLQEFVLSPNVPNPFNPSTQISYEIPEAGHVRLVIYNTLGQEIRILVQDHQTPGRYRVTWDGKDMSGREVSSGVYFYRLIHSGKGAVTRQLLLIK